MLEGHLQYVRNLSDFGRGENKQFQSDQERRQVRKHLQGGTS
jgi:hypothetical protein